MTVLLIISILLVVSFVGTAIWKMKGLPESISAMVNIFEGAWKWLWSIWLMAVAICTFAPVIDVLDQKGLGIFGFFPMGLLGFVAAMPIFDTDHKNVHDVLGIVAGFLSQVAVVIMCPLWLFAWSLFVFLMGSVYVQPKGWLARAVQGKWTFVAEVVCWMAVVGAAMTCI